MAKDVAIVLNNGSMNSAVVSALAAQRYRPVLLYAQTTAQLASRQSAAYEQQVAYFKPYRQHSLSMSYLSMAQDAAASSSGGDSRPVPGLAGRLLDLMPLVAVAARFAVGYQAAAVYLGLRVGPQGDELAQATEYGQIWNELLQLPCAQTDFEIMTPLLELEPWQVVDVGVQVGAPFEHAWSCLEEGPEPCWACRGCRARDAAFQQAGKPDPLRTAKRPS